MALETARHKMEMVFRHSLLGGATLAMTINYIVAHYVIFVAFYHIGGWRISFEIVGFPSFHVLLITSPFFVESPTFLIQTD